jgi:hypothetical protein
MEMADALFGRRLFEVGSIRTTDNNGIATRSALGNDHHFL